MALTQQERERVKYFLGYPTTSTAASLTFGLARPVQTLFLVEDAMTLLPLVSEGRLRQLLNILDGIEARMVDAQERLAVTQLEELHLRDGEPDLLEKEYARWANRLANLLGVPLYPYSDRFMGSGASVPVRS